MLRLRERMVAIPEISPVERLSRGDAETQNLTDYLAVAVTSTA